AEMTTSTTNKNSEEKSSVQENDDHEVKSSSASTKALTSPSQRIETIYVPDIGSDDSVQVIEVMINEGDLVKQDDPLITLESDKASMEIPSPMTGKIQKVLVNVGNKVGKGDEIAIVEFQSTSTHKTTTIEKPKAAQVTSAPEEAPTSTVQRKAV